MKPKKVQGSNFSNKAVIVVIVAFILVSLLCLALFLDALNVPEPKVIMKDTVQGTVTLTIKAPTPTTDSTTGKASIKIIEGN